MDGLLDTVAEREYLAYLASRSGMPRSADPAGARDRWRQPPVHGASHRRSAALALRALLDQVSVLSPIEWRDRILWLTRSSDQMAEPAV